MKRRSCHNRNKKHCPKQSYVPTHNENSCAKEANAKITAQGM